MLAELDVVEREGLVEHGYGASLNASRTFSARASRSASSFEVGRLKEHKIIRFGCELR